MASSKRIRKIAAKDEPLPPGLTHGGKEAGEAIRKQLAAWLDEKMPPSERAAKLVDLLKQQAENPMPGAGNPNAQLAVLRYINELSGVVTMVQEKGADASVELPQIIVHGEPPPRPGSREALELLQQAKGSQYDEKFPLSPPAPPEPPKPFKSAVSVQERSGA